MGVTLTMGISGCGLKGDLYLDKAEPDQAEAQETAASIDTEITSDWTGPEAAALEEAIAEAAGMSEPTAVMPTGPVTTIPEPATSDAAENPAENIEGNIKDDAGSTVDSTAEVHTESANISAVTETDGNISAPSITLAPEGTVPAL